MKKYLLLLTTIMFFSCGPSLCTCVSLDDNTLDPDDLPGFGGIEQRTYDLFDDCWQKFDGWDNIKSRKNECK